MAAGVGDHDEVADDGPDIASLGRSTAPVTLTTTRADQHEPRPRSTPGPSRPAASSPGQRSRAWSRPSEVRPDDDPDDAEDDRRPEVDRQATASSGRSPNWLARRRGPRRRVPKTVDRRDEPAGQPARAASSYRRAIDSPSADVAEPERRRRATDQRAVDRWPAGRRRRGRSLAGVSVSKTAWSGSARTTRPWTTANRIVPNSRVRAPTSASGCRARTTAGSRIARPTARAWRT